MKIEESSGKGWGIYLSSRCEDYPCRLNVRVPGYWLTLHIPQVIKPVRHWRDLSRMVGTSGYAWLKPNADGRYGHHETFPREYSVSYSDGYLHVHYGQQTHDSTTDKSKCWELPWMAWRFIRCSFYDLKGRHFYSEWDNLSPGKRNAWECRKAAEDALPKAAFEFDDFDGQRITATTHIEEREWRYGKGAFRWLSLFRKPMIRRSLALNFSAEVGPEKGSWKGGTMGTSIPMLPGETHEAAFRRYCEQEHRSKYRTFRVRYVGPASELERAA